ncbi:hypothetical protein G6F63_014194 [Rhizopus arrhizus]|nr:hypothetical protein G6F63_014194 [Rhizopus arrhizus]
MSGAWKLPDVPGGFLLAADIQGVAAVVGLVAAIAVIARRRGGDHAVQQRDLELDAGRVARALAATAVDVLQVEVDAGAWIGTKVITLLRHFGHGGERNRAGPALDQFTGDVRRGLVDPGAGAILRNGPHLPVLLRRQRVPPA